MSNYTFILQSNQARQSPIKWHDFQKRMASYLVKQPPIKQLLGRSVDELDSQLAVCPCGQGLVVVEAQQLGGPWQPPSYFVRVLCPTCRQQFDTRLEELSPMTAIEPNLRVWFTDAANGQQVAVEPNTVTNWKMLSWR